MPVMLERWNDDKMDGLSEKVDGLGVRATVLEEKVDGLAVELREQRREMKAGFDRIDARFERIDDRFERVDDRFERVDDRFYELQKETKEGFEAMHRSMTRNAITICGVFIAALVAWPG